MIETNFNVAFTNDEVNRRWLNQLLADGVVAVTSACLAMVVAPPTPQGIAGINGTDMGATGTQ